MHGIYVHYDENRDFAYILKAIDTSCCAEQLSWLITSLYADIAKLQVESQILDISERISKKLPFKWQEILSLAIDDTTQECSILGFEHEKSLQDFRLSKNRNPCQISISGADNYIWFICVQDRDILDRIANHFSHPEPLKKHWIAKRFDHER